MTFELWMILGATLTAGFTGFLIVVFLGFWGNYQLNQGEMRRAITAFFIILFGLLVVASYFPLNIDLPKEIQGLFAGTVTTIIGFYFGSRSTQTSGTTSENPPPSRESSTPGGSPSDASTQPPGAG